MQRIGSRAQVMHGNAKMTGGGLKKRDLKYNKQGKIVSKKMSQRAKKEKRLQKAGYTTIKGQFGAVRSMKGGSLYVDGTYNSDLSTIVDFLRENQLIPRSLTSYIHSTKVKNKSSVKNVLKQIRNNNNINITKYQEQQLVYYIINNWNNIINSFIVSTSRVNKTFNNTNLYLPNLPNLPNNKISIEIRKSIQSIANKITIFKMVNGSSAYVKGSVTSSNSTSSHFHLQTLSSALEDIDMLFQYP